MIAENSDFGELIKEVENIKEASVISPSIIVKFGFLIDRLKDFEIFIDDAKNLSDEDSFVLYYTARNLRFIMEKIEERFLAFKGTESVTENATKLIENFYKKSVDLADTYHNLSGALVAKDVLNNFVGEYREAFKQKPDHAEFQYFIDPVLATKGLLDEDIRKFDKAIGEFNNFVGEYREAFKQKPDHAEFQYFIGPVLVAKDILDEAIYKYKEELKVITDLSQKATLESLDIFENNMKKELPFEEPFPEPSLESSSSLYSDMIKGAVDPLLQKVNELMQNGAISIDEYHKRIDKLNDILNITNNELEKFKALNKMYIKTINSEFEKFLNTHLPSDVSKIAEDVLVILPQVGKAYSTLIGVLDQIKKGNELLNVSIEPLNEERRNFLTDMVLEIREKAAEVSALPSLQEEVKEVDVKLLKEMIYSIAEDLGIFSNEKRNKGD